MNINMNMIHRYRHIDIDMDIARSPCGRIPLVLPDWVPVPPEAASGQQPGRRQHAVELRHAANLQRAAAGGPGEGGSPAVAPDDSTAHLHRGTCPTRPAIFLDLV